MDAYNTLGLGGDVKVISGTSAVTPDANKYFCAIVALNGDAVINTITMGGTAYTTDVTIKDNNTIVTPRCSSVTLTSGYGWGYQTPIVP